ncbi:threonine synthase [Polynucleobacter sp. JS-Safj-400b-B2]|uniref:threonine synthase n=1 Tax=Polynucleobacter sp. JS-Safj-400b-B2 TaxID=2576921 RepID=UPI001C0B1955|nr:threonine synthase [Polynucleobacter sp. JS-Safj-400b-B2]MBU3624758.1 threonine synthase [Polynucleobacter sp. JS-Safj-400b-B2]
MQTILARKNFNGNLQTGNNISRVMALRCLNCLREYEPLSISYCCPVCELSGSFDVIYNYDVLGATFMNSLKECDRFDMWRYQILLPVQRPLRLNLHTGGSPLYEFEHSGCGQVLIKDDSRNPSGSLKDRASALAVAMAVNQGFSTVSAASTGNAAAALACMCATQNLECIIFAPSKAPREKLAQIKAYGATVIEVSGGYDEAFDECHRRSNENGWYNRSTGFNSYMSEGKKTVAFEICEQMGWRAPDKVFVPVGNGCIVGSVYKGFQELFLMNCIDRMPKIIGVQAQGSDYMCRVWEAEIGPHTGKIIESKTGASSISVALPRDRIKALRAIKDSGGQFIRVSDAEIYEGVVHLACGSGVFAEPGAAAAFAGAKKLGAFSAEETSVVLITGSGLKDISGLVNSGALGIDPGSFRLKP